MNAVVLTAVLSCLKSGMYSASRMLFVLAARREAPLQLVSVTRRGVPAMAIAASSIVGFLCVIAERQEPHHGAHDLERLLECAVHALVAPAVAGTPRRGGGPQGESEVPGCGTT